VPLDYGLRDRVVLVTGAASGIGRTTAELLAGMGAAGEVAAAIAWPCSDAASFVTGEALTIEGGLLAR